MPWKPILRSWHFAFLFLPFTLFIAPFPAGAEASTPWEPRIYNIAVPERIVAVDKNQQQFYLFEKKSPLKLTLNYPCTTGQVVGDKQKLNDLRTPEGIYFVEYKISSGLDFKEYGGIAYTLNYPNPVDKLRGKTGYGIWIHSKGEAITPRITRGCIAIDLENIAEVGPMLTPGTPVVVAEALGVEGVSPQNTPLDEGSDDRAVARHLRLQMEQWTRAWASRSEDFFKFYNQEAYTRAMPESFQAFRSNKERLFKILKWINIFNREVYVLEGPGYWVTWAEQFYRAPNLSTEGIRRLYWQRDESQRFRIVGMEWIPRNVGMQAAYEKGQLVAKTENIATDAMPLAAPQPVAVYDPVQGEKPLLPPLTMPEQPDEPAQELPLPQASPDNPQREKPVGLAQSSLPILAQNTPPKAEGGAASIRPASDELRKALQKQVFAWAEAWQKLQLKDFLAFYDVKKYGSTHFAALKSEMTRRLHVPWVEIMQSPARVRQHGKQMITDFDQWIYSPGSMPVQGKRTLFWEQSAGNGGARLWRIVASDWEEKSLEMNVLYLEKISDSVMSWIEDWRKAWLSADVDDYAVYYAPHARQGTRAKVAMMQQKRTLWQSAAPKAVEFNGIRVQLDSDGVRVDMTQIYKDENGRGDKGVKTLILQPYNKAPGKRTWRIVREEWEAL